MGVMRPPGIDTAMPMSACLCFTMAFSVQVTLASGTLMSAMAMALMMKSLTEIFQRGLPSLSLGACRFRRSRSSSRWSRVTSTET